MPQYRFKPVVVEAVQETEWRQILTDDSDGSFWLTAPGQWVVTFPNRRQWPLRAGTFAALLEPVADTPDDSERT